MLDASDGGRSTEDVTAIAGPGSAEVIGEGEVCGAVEPVAAQAQQQLRIAFEPARGGLDGHIGGARRQRVSRG